MKVCIEIVMMAVDGGCISAGEKVIVIAGTGHGADTAILVQAASSRRLPDLHVMEIICKPLQTKQRIPNLFWEEGPYLPS